MMSLGQLMNLLGNLSIFMSSQSVRKNLHKDGKGKTKLKVNGH